MNKIKLIIYAVITVAIIWGGLCIYSWTKGIPVVELFHQENKMERTATILRNVNSINRWIFLVVENEEIVVRKHWLGDVAKIYPLEHQLGIELSDNTEWVEIHENDGIKVAILQLPPIKVLNSSGIDATKIINVYGNADRQEHIDMMEEAEKKSEQRAKSKTNIEQAKKNAKEHFTSLFMTLGCDSVKIEWSNK